MQSELRLLLLKVSSQLTNYLLATHYFQAMQYITVTVYEVT